jgi:hypothetical protein
MYIPGLVSKQKMLAFIDQYSQEHPLSTVADADPVAERAPPPVKPAESGSGYTLTKAKPVARAKKKISM